MLCNSATGSCWPAYARTRDGKTPLVSAYYVYYILHIQSAVYMVYAHGWIKEPLLMTGFSSRLLLCGQRDRIIDRLFDDSMCVVFSFIYFFFVSSDFLFIRKLPLPHFCYSFLFSCHTWRPQHSSTKQHMCIYIKY